MSWSSTLRLPKSTFPPRTLLADQAKYLQRCTDDLYKWQRNHRPAKDNSFILQDGPPYANGGLHVGHALNKILKDIITRTQLAQGKRISYVPGWDCHGLPIELKALEQHGWKDRKTSDAVAIRQAARIFAQAAVEQQMKGFKSWAVMGDWDGHWKTMDRSFELRQLAVFKAMASKGLIYRRHKPVYWSPSSKTALAEAELEYNEDHVSTAVLVKFPFGQDQFRKVSAVVWTTTPWTLPANQAIAINQELLYMVVKSKKHGSLLIAESRLQFVEKLLGEKLKVITHGIIGHALLRSSYEGLPAFEIQSRQKPIIHADFVSPDAGTGLVHCAPGHGMDDYEALQGLIRRGEIDVKAPIDDNGCFTDEAVPGNPDLLLGQNVFQAGNKSVLDILNSSGFLLAQHKYKHKYPYDWRTKQPILIRATAQWFADVSSVRQSALKSLNSVEFRPETGKTRLTSFVANRSEWCISRQRAWGVPIPALYHQHTGEAVLTASSVAHIIKVVGERGIDSWWSDDVNDSAWIVPELLSSEGGSDYRRGTDTMDVWFDSGTSWTGMAPDDLTGHVPVADVYIEGTDQHRGWFQSSLLTHNAYQASLFPDQPQIAPFRSLITHGFTLDGEGKKMSKSIGNVVSPDEIIAGEILNSKGAQVATKSNKRQKQVLPLGADVLRLWVASSDFTKDVVIGDTVIKSTHTALHKYRVTLKLLLGNMQDFSAATDALPYNSLSRVDKIALLHLHQVTTTVREAMAKYEFHKAVNAVNRWIVTDLSNFYIEAVKDILYCDKPDGQRRRGVQTVLDHVLCQMQAMLGPLTPMLVEESWEHSPASLRAGREPPLQRILNPIPTEWYDNQLATVDLAFITSVNTAVKAAQERARAEKKMGSSLDSDVVINLDPSVDADALLLRQPKAIGELAEILVVSNLTIASSSTSSCCGRDGATSKVPPLPSAVDWSYEETIRNAEGKVLGVAVVYAPRDRKCGRCWRYLVREESKDLCGRCEDVVPVTESPALA